MSERKQDTWAVSPEFWKAVQSHPKYEEMISKKAQRLFDARDGRGNVTADDDWFRAERQLRQEIEMQRLGEYAKNGKVSRAAKVRLAVLHGIGFIMEKPPSEVFPEAPLDGNRLLVEISISAAAKDFGIELPQMPDGVTNVGELVSALQASLPKKAKPRKKGKKAGRPKRRRRK